MHDTKERLSLLWIFVLLNSLYACYAMKGKNILELKIRKIGNSLGVVLPKKAVARLNAREGDRLFLVEALDHTYRLTLYNPAFAKKMKKAEDTRPR
jgi:putative addiction module antidote